VHIDTVLLKVASRCNLNCSYCYVYHMGDESWRNMPKRMSLATEVAVAEELAALRRAQGRPFSVVLHGGEPLLLGAARLEGMLQRLRQALGTVCGISIQTNGVLISDAILDICADQNVTLSVSLDGPAVVHDRLRVDLRGRATHALVVRGIEALKRHPARTQLFSGVLAVVDPQSSPEDVYEYFKGLGVPSVDFLYRDGNHTDLPHGKTSPSSTEYGRWITTILDLYIADREPFRIRMLDDMMKLLLGGLGVKEGVGLTDYGILVIDTDGSVKKNDTLKSSPLGDRFDFAWKIGDHSLADIAASPAFHSYHLAQRPTSMICGKCSLLKICGGGMLTHRFKDESGYNNPTVFCADQQMLIARMREHIGAFLHPARAA
jgi:uncharacterized protein